jgi:hypothetical protein
MLQGADGHGQSKQASSEFQFLQNVELPLTFVDLLPPKEQATASAVPPSPISPERRSDALRLPANIAAAEESPVLSNVNLPRPRQIAWTDTEEQLNLRRTVMEVEQPEDEAARFTAMDDIASAAEAFRGVEDVVMDISGSRVIQQIPVSGDFNDDTEVVSMDLPTADAAKSTAAEGNVSATSTACVGRHVHCPTVAERQFMMVSYVNTLAVVRSGHYLAKHAALLLAILLWWVTLTLSASVDTSLGLLASSSCSAFKASCALALCLDACVVDTLVSMWLVPALRRSLFAQRFCCSREDDETGRQFLLWRLVYNGVHPLPGRMRQLYLDEWQRIAPFACAAREK